jgi:hypothetical protein
VTNRLADSTSPYLLQHKDNPVDWWPWSPAAFDEARRRDVPILLSVGYAACHWCHVMAHESFENDDIASYMNEHFVNVKVDREERPDVDAVYMAATQAMTGHGGWPMTCVLTPDGQPFFCGTYFPDRPRLGSASFPQVLESVVAAWRDRRGEISRIGAEVVEHLNRQQVVGGAGPPTAEALESAVSRLAGEFDPVNAGFGGAPKFPPSMVCEFLLRHAARTGSGTALDMAARTCEHMARGGIYDQLAGGFARYSVDEAWAVPHFEKMLYDNALLLRVYLHWHRLTGSPLAGRVARETADFLVRDLGTPEGGFASALDADSEGVEGRYYVWTPAPGRRACSGSQRPARSSTGLRLCGCSPTPTTPPASAQYALRWRRRDGNASHRGATTRWSPHGTGWPLPPSPRRGCCSRSPAGWRRRAAAPSCSRACTSATTAGWPERRGAAPSAPTPGYSRTTPTWRRVCWRCSR